MSSFSGFVDKHARWIYPSFAIAFIFAMMLFPLGYTIYNSLMDWSLTYRPEPMFVGLANYVKIFTSDTRFLSSLWTTTYFTGLAMVIEVVLGVLIAIPIGIISAYRQYSWFDQIGTFVRRRNDIAFSTQLGNDLF